MARFDTVIRNGMIVDGTRVPRRRGDVAIKDGRIARVGSVPADDADTVLDADGLIVAPGFIDLHTHYDAQVFWDAYCSLSGWHGAKAGDLPTDDEHAEMKRLLHEAMNAGAGGWSAQKLHPDGGVSIQRDFDGTPMVSDVMHSETCFVLAEVLAERNVGFIQMTSAPRKGEDNHVFMERLAEISGRAVIMNVVQAFDA